MSEANLSALFWEGFRIDAYGVKASDQIHIRLVPDPAAFHDGLGGGAMNRIAWKLRGGRGEPDLPLGSRVETPAERANRWTRQVLSDRRRVKNVLVVLTVCRALPLWVGSNVFRGFRGHADRERWLSRR